MDKIEYTRPAGTPVLAFMMPLHLALGQDKPELAPGEPLPMGTFAFDAKPDTIGTVSVDIMKHLLMPHGSEKPGNIHCVEAIRSGRLRFRRSDLRQIEYKGEVSGSLDPLLGIDESGEERRARLERERIAVDAAARAASLDKELELERLKAKRAEDERLKAEAEAKRAEAELKLSEQKRSKKSADKPATEAEPQE